MLHTEDSAIQPARAIQEGDLVVVYEGFESMKAVRVTSGEQYQNKFGSFWHKEWLGKPFGCKVTSRKGDGWVLLLAPTPELWSSVLRHRTQILYIADISMVCALLELRPGCTVLESGTGSGSLTTSLARAVAPTGHIWTFEFHEQRAELAAEEFKVNGLSGLVTVGHRDIEEAGFPEALHGRADALFLDLPKPHLAVESAARCVRPDGMFCSFSPCIEQVQRTCEALNAHGFRDIRSMEILLRQHEVSRQVLITELDAPPPNQQSRKQQRQQEQAGGRGGGRGGRGAKRQRTANGRVDAGAEAAAAAGSGEAAAPAAVPTAVAAGDAADGIDAAAAAAAPAAAGGAQPGSQQQGSAPSSVQQQQPQQQPEALLRQVVSKPVPFGRGHTGYLTFARRVVPL